MPAFARLWRRLHPPLRSPLYYHRSYRLPLAEGLKAGAFEPRRADFVRWFLLSEHLLRPGGFLEPTKVSWDELALVHTPEYLESLASAEHLAEIYSVSPRSFPVDAVLDSNRLAVGGTVQAAQRALRDSSPVLNLLGGFHHAGPSFGAGFCAMNDVAVAIRVLRRDGFSGPIGILDLDAHQPDGTVRCLEGVPGVWMGSLSSASFGELPGVDEVILPGAGDHDYLQALERMLERMPRAELTFVVAGGDVLEGDRFGRFTLTLAGARRRDEKVRDAVAGRGSVWLPAGGYSPHSWRVLAGTALTLFRVRDIVPDIDPLERRFADVAQRIPEEALTGGGDFGAEDLDVLFGQTESRDSRFLGFYTAAGLEYALFRYGILEFLTRLGYGEFRVTITSSGVGQQATLHAHYAASPVTAASEASPVPRGSGPEVSLIELAAEKKSIDDRTFLYIHWLSLRHPAGEFTDRRPKLPGQEVPGLGLAREISKLTERIAERLGLAGVAFRPSSFHVAFTARHRFRFQDPAVEGRFQALLRDVAPLPVAQASQQIAAGAVTLNGAPWSWEPALMISTGAGGEGDAAEVARVCAKSHFVVA